MRATEWIRSRIWEDKVMASFPDVQNMTTRRAFITRRIAMVEDGPWALKDILTGADFRIGAGLFPAGPVRRVTLARRMASASRPGRNIPRRPGS